MAELKKKPVFMLGGYFVESGIAAAEKVCVIAGFIGGPRKAKMGSSGYRPNCPTTSPNPEHASIILRSRVGSFLQTKHFLTKHVKVEQQPDR
jgi:hypothetical protein